ncbi:MAG: cytochrome c3 family protein [Candidatus Aminicenantes bacterium]|nr:cytochrome c3 family protein [Candidatus Aminicenantes bacterium]
MALRNQFNPLRIFPTFMTIIAVSFALTLFLGAKNSGEKIQKTEDCRACHEEVVKAFNRTPHQQENCSACHQGAEKHVEEGTKESIFSFTAEKKPSEKIKPCLACHHPEAGHYPSSPHGRSNLDCTACHSIHSYQVNPSNLKASAVKICASCHQDILAEFKLNERHRLQEGILECLSCHRPHEPAERPQLGGFKQQACLQCHVDKGGPFLYEHEPLRIEGCTTCHSPHGSPNRHLLLQQSVADLCFSCHGTAPAWHSRFTSMTTNCTTCHVAIHGSNLNRLFLK